MDLTAKTLLQNRNFLLGLSIRLFLIAFAIPEIATQWFLPFLREFAQFPSLDPWSTHLQLGGGPRDFPYGIVMYLAYLPLVSLGGLLDSQLHTSVWEYVGLGITSLIWDITLCILLIRLCQGYTQKIINYYWLSPLVIYICYWHGQLDIFPVMLLVLSLYLLKNLRPELAGIALGASLAAKLSMALAVPLVIIYLWRNRRLRTLFKPFVQTFGLTTIVLMSPYLFSSGFRSMVLESPEIAKIYAFVIPISPDHQIYLLPIAYACIVYCAWWLERMNADMLFAFVGVAFSLILLFTDASVGWYMWLMPFLVIHLTLSQRLTIYLAYTFSFLLVGYSLLDAKGATLSIFSWTIPDIYRLDKTSVSAHHLSLLFSIIAALQILLTIRMVLRGIKNNDYFRLSRQPLAVGIAGDSGAGKDTLNNALADLFGNDAVTFLFGDDYHKWDRFSPMWQINTHLNPKANHLDEFVRDAIKLIDGKAVTCCHYDHKVGRFSKSLRVNQNDIVLVSGLHTLYSPQLSAKFDLKVFLDMEEPLRKFLKLRRDVLERKHSEEKVIQSMEKRAPDYLSYIKPQKDNADLVFSLSAVRIQDIVDFQKNSETIPMKLFVTLKDSIYCENLARMLIGICGMHVDIQPSDNASLVKMEIEGDVSGEDLQIACQRLVPHMDELLALKPRWHSNMLGVMQLITVLHIAERLHARS